MEKTATLNLRVNPAVKERAESVLSKLGVPMSVAIDIDVYKRQDMTGGNRSVIFLDQIQNFQYLWF